MPGYVNPIDLIGPYLQPLTMSVNTGIDQGVKLEALRQAAAKEKMLEPYYAAHSALYNATVAEKDLAAKRLNETLGRVSAGGGGTMAPTGGLTPQQLIDYHILGITKPELLQPVDTPVVEAGGIMRTIRGGPSTFVPTTGLAPKVTPRDMINGDQVQTVIVDRAGNAKPMPITSNVAIMNELAQAPEFLFGKGIPTMSEPEITTQTTEALPGPRFRLPEDKKLTIGHRDSLTIGDQVVTQEVIGFKDDGAPIWKEVARGDKFKAKTAAEDAVAKDAALKRGLAIMAEKFLDYVPADKKGPIQNAFLAANQIGGSVNPALVRDALPTAALKNKWDGMRILMEENVKTMAPQQAFNKANQDYTYANILAIPPKAFVPAASPATSSPGPNGMSKTSVATTTTVGGPAKDRYGYVLGQGAEKNGKKYKYIGNDQWQKF